MIDGIEIQEGDRILLEKQGLYYSRKIPRWWQWCKRMKLNRRAKQFNGIYTISSGSWEKK